MLTEGSTNNISFRFAVMIIRKWRRICFPWICFSKFFIANLHVEFVNSTIDHVITYTIRLNILWLAFVYIHILIKNHSAGSNNKIRRIHSFAKANNRFNASIFPYYYLALSRAFVTHSLGQSKTVDDSASQRHVITTQSILLHVHWIITFLFAKLLTHWPLEHMAVISNQ